MEYKFAGTSADTAAHPGAARPGAIYNIAQTLLKSEAELTLTSQSLKAMAHPLRLKIVCIVDGSGGEVCVNDIIQKVGTSQSNVSQHLTKLRDCGIIACRRDLNRVLCRIADDRIHVLMNTLRDAFGSATC